MTHVDIFTGLAGFVRACEWAGIHTEVMCEKDERCRQFLERTYPDIPIVSDVRDFDGTKWRGRFLLTAGVPCQPASRAGKQRGKDDDRWLWPEAIRIIQEARPAWAICENPPGIGDVGLHGILFELERSGYDFPRTLDGKPVVFSVPACTVNSPQIRQRVWIVAHSQGNHDTGRPSEIQRQNEQQKAERPKNRDAEFGSATQGNLAHPTGGQFQDPGRRPEGRNGIAPAGEGDMADTESHDLADGAEQIAMQQGAKRRRIADRSRGLQIGTQLSDFWSNYLWTSCADGKFRRTPDYAERMADGISTGILEELAEEGWPHRSVLAALGNSIVSQVAYQIIEAIKEAS